MEEKLFKKFEKKLAPAIKEMHRLMVDSCNRPDHLKMIREITKWDRIVKTYNQGEVHWAVYHSSTAEQWQVFRAGLKGLTTKQKLYMLEILLVRTDGAVYVAGLRDAPKGTNLTEAQKERDLNYIRVDNYLGALVRGGQLDASYCVQRD